MRHRIDSVNMQKVISMAISDNDKQICNILPKEYNNAEDIVIFLRLCMFLHKKLIGSLTACDTFLIDYAYKHNYLITTTDDFERRLWNTYTYLYIEPYENKYESIHDRIYKDMIASKSYIESVIYHNCSMHGEIFLKHNINLNSSLENTCYFSIFLEFILSNIYNHSITLKNVFDKLKKLPLIDYRLRRLVCGYKTIGKFLLDISMYRKDFDEDILIKHSKIIHKLLYAYRVLRRSKFIEFLLVLNNKFSVDVLKETNFLIDPEETTLPIENLRLENVSKIIVFMKKHNKEYYIKKYSHPLKYNIIRYCSKTDMFICKCGDCNKYKSLNITEFIYTILHHRLINMICRDIYLILNMDKSNIFLLKYI